VVLTLIRPKLNIKPVSILVMICAFISLGAFEWMREAARRPYVINQVMYSNGLLPSEVDSSMRDGFVPTAKWTSMKEVTEENMLQAGKELFILQCHACHTIDGLNNDIVPRTANMTFRAMVGYLETMHEKRPFMPPFAGSKMEAQALSAYLVGGLHGKEVQLEPPEETRLSGAVLFEENCSVCHGLDEIQPGMADWELVRIREVLDALSELNEEMEDYDGTAEEKDAMAEYLFEAVKGGAK
jgi:mono/diheme cytochrome c family protein